MRWWYSSNLDPCSLPLRLVCCFRRCQCSRDCVVEELGLERLGQHLPDANRCYNLLSCGDHDHRHPCENGRPGTPLTELPPVHARHHQIEEDHVYRQPAFDLADGLAGVREPEHIVAIDTEQSAQRSPQVVIVVDNCDPCSD